MPSLGAKVVVREVLTHSSKETKKVINKHRNGCILALRFFHVVTPRRRGPLPGSRTISLSGFGAFLHYQDPGLSLNSTALLVHYTPGTLPSGIPHFHYMLKPSNFEVHGV